MWCDFRGAAIRPAWFTVHWLFGTAAIILGWFNIFKGLDVYVQSWPIGGERKVSLEFHLTVVAPGRHVICDKYYFQNFIMEWFISCCEWQATYVFWGVQLAILGFLLLLFDRLPYIKAQAKVPGAIANVTKTPSVENLYVKTDASGPDGRPTQWPPV